MLPPPAAAPAPDLFEGSDRSGSGSNGGGGGGARERRLLAYYCTGGTVVTSEVGKFHVMDRSTHPLLSPSSVANRRSLIEASRRQKAAERKGKNPSGVTSTSSTARSAMPTNSGCGSIYSSPAPGSMARSPSQAAAAREPGSLARGRSRAAPPAHDLDRSLSLVDSSQGNDGANDIFDSDDDSPAQSDSPGLPSTHPSAIAKSSLIFGGRSHGPPASEANLPMAASDSSHSFDHDMDSGSFAHEHLSSADEVKKNEFRRRRRARARTIFTHPDPVMQSCFDAMDFIPTIDCPSLSEPGQTSSAVNPAVLLQIRTSILAPVLTACYTCHGGAASIAVDGLARLLNETDFFSPDVQTSVPHDATECSMRLTLLDLAVQVVCDVATSTSREVLFRPCVNFVGDSLRCAGGNLNARTIGYAFRFYLFVFYFGASIPRGGWPNDTSSDNDKGLLTAESLMDLPLLDDGTKGDKTFDISSGLLERLRKKRGYLAGGATHGAALALKDLMSLIIGRMETISPPDRERLSSMVAANLASTTRRSNAQDHDCHRSKDTVGAFIKDIVSDGVDGSINHVDMADYAQLALHQVHRSGGSELFWHDMMTSCGIGLFAREEVNPDAATSQEKQFRYIVAFSTLSSLVKVASGKVRRVEESTKLVPRDIVSKILSLELLLHFLGRWREIVMKENMKETVVNDSGRSSRGHHPYDHHKDSRDVVTMAFAIRRLVVSCLLSNTNAALENPRVFRRAVLIISELWRSPLYRHYLKLELAVLIEHFFIKVLRLGPQVLSPRRIKAIGQSRRGRQDDSSLLDQFSSPLLSHQYIVLAEITKWFSSDPKDLLELFLNFDIVDVTGKGNLPMLPGSYWKITLRLCEALCGFTERCGEISAEQIQATKLSGSGGVGGLSLAAAYASAVVETADVAEITLLRDGARALQAKGFEAIGQIIKCFMQCAVLTSGDSFKNIKAREPLFGEEARTSQDDHTTRPQEKLVSDANRYRQDQCNTAPASSSSDTDESLENGLNLGSSAASSPLRHTTPQIHQVSIKHSYNSPSYPSNTSADMRKYWQISLAERRRMAMSPLGGGKPHMSNFASPDLRISPTSESIAKNEIPPSKPVMPLLSSSPPKVNRKYQDLSVGFSSPLRTASKPSVSNPSMEAEKVEQTMKVALELMATKSVKKAIDYLVACNLITPSAREVASFLRLHRVDINAEALGNYLGEGGKDGAEVEHYNLIRFNYVRAIAFVGMNVEQGLRHFLTNCGFRLPGEAQKIDRIISTFAQCYWEDVSLMSSSTTLLFRLLQRLLMVCII